MSALPRFSSILCLLLVIASTGSASAQDAATPHVVLSLPPGPGNTRNSEGDFLQLKDGRLIFVYTYFRDGGSGRGGDHDPAELRQRTSHDGGQTWSDDEQTILAESSGLNVMSVSLLRLQSGRIALFYLNKVSLTDCRPEMRISTDEGQTWSQPVQCITDEIGYYVLNNDRAIQLRNGRLILPVALHRTKTDDKFRPEAKIMGYLSDDQGQTWRRSHSVLTFHDANGKQVATQEPGVVELKDGELMLFVRSSAGSQLLSTSSDGGENWSELATSNIISPLSPASIERIPSTGDLLLVWNNHDQIDPALRGKRTPLTVAVSRDEGRTWEHVKNLYVDPHGWYCYTAIEFVDDFVLLGHCAGDRRKGGLSQTDLTRFSLSWLYQD